ncbi:hypothetical protein [Komagataeibacter oboediens]|uniref:hypothetical protein n=1 Tax=Komagataeibacter oboediens TaxID=65958 RepID=UPI0020C3A53A|nr:hypothetical protein [Komagataeibacter oboediens]
MMPFPSARTSCKQTRNCQAPSGALWSFQDGFSGWCGGICGDPCKNLLCLELDPFLFHPSTGSRIWLKADGSISIAPASGKTAVAGDLTASGTITGNEVMAQGIKLFSHPHDGVELGNSRSGPPQSS